MKKILASAAALFMVLGIATASFAAEKPNGKTAPAKTAQATKTAKHKKHKKAKKAKKMNSKSAAPADGTKK